MLGVLRVLERSGPRFRLADAGRAVGLSAARLVQRFGGRAGLVRAAFAYWGQAGIHGLETVAAAERPLASFLHWIGTGSAGTSATGARHSLSWMQLAAEDPVLRRWYRDYIDRYLIALAGLLDRGIAAGELRPTDASILARRIVVGAAGAMVLAIARDDVPGWLGGGYRRELEATLEPYRTRPRAARRRVRPAMTA